MFTSPKQTYFIWLISIYVVYGATVARFGGVCTCEGHDLIACDLDGDLSVSDCAADTACSTKIVTHDGDEEHMHDKELTCCFPVSDDVEQSIYYQVPVDDGTHYTNYILMNPYILIGFCAFIAVILLCNIFLVWLECCTNQQKVMHYVHNEEI